MRALLGALAGLLLSGAAAAETASHGLSAFGDLKYPKDFAHFGYVNPAAPKGGTLTMSTSVGTLTFDSFNPFILKGDTPEGLSLLAHDTGESLVYDCLMTRAGDEPDSLYGLLAESVTLAPDRSRAVFRLRKEARFHDGSPLTAADVVFTLRSVKEKGHPLYRMNMRDVTVLDPKDPYTVEVRFAGESRRDAPLFVAEFPIASAAFYKTHNFEETSLDRPLGSGPYKIGAFKPGSYIDYDRVPDYWAKDLNVVRGRWNFDRIRYEYYRDRHVGFQAFTAGGYDLREEFTSKTWATEYNFPALKDGRVKQLTLADHTPSGTQGFFINTRRAKFRDPKVRLALDYAFDFAWMNKTIFYGMYLRTVSYFQNSEMMAEGPPTPGELALLEPFRDRLPKEVFGPAYVPPATDGSGNNRDNLLKARALLRDAGYSVKDGKLVGPDGQTLAIEFLADDQQSANLVQPYLQNLTQLGIAATVRLVDPAQYERLRKAFDYDLIIMRYSQRLTPGIELRDRFGSSGAATEGTYNFSGVADPAVDAMIEAAIAAQSRDELVTAVRALDRLLRAGHYWVPHWYKAEHHIAYWNKFGRPPVQPRYQRGIIDTWWIDPAKAR